MGYLNPLFRLPAGKALLDLPAGDKKRIEAVMRDLREQANHEADTAWKRRKGPMAAYWRAVSTYARHIAHALSKTTTAIVICRNRFDRKEHLRSILVDTINREIARTGISPEEAASVLAEEAHAALMCLGWRPHPQRAAVEHLHCAAACLNDGRVIPVPGFEDLFPVATTH